MNSLKTKILKDIRSSVLIEGEESNSLEVGLNNISKEIEKDYGVFIVHFAISYSDESNVFNDPTEYSYEIKLEGINGFEFYNNHGELQFIPVKNDELVDALIHLNFKYD